MSEVTSSEVERFIEDNRLDDSAGRNLRGEAPHVQRTVIDRGSLAECQNPSSAVIGRIRDAKNSSRALSAIGSNSGGVTTVVSSALAGGGLAGGLAGGYSGAYGMTMAVPQPVYGSQDPAAAAAAAAAAAYQQAYFAAAQAAQPQAAAAMPQGYYEGASGYGGMPGYAQQPMMGYYNAQAAAGQFVQVQGYGMMAAQPGMQMAYPQYQVAAQPQAAYPTMQAVQQSPSFAVTASSPAVGVSAVASSEVEDFISTSRLDESAAKNLRSEPIHIQRAVIDRGSLAECVNPSSALIGRIRDAKHGNHAPIITSAPLGRSVGLQDSATDTEAVDAFIQDNRLDESAARSLRGEPLQVQMAVINRGSLAECQNPSSAVIGRIRDAKLQFKYPDRVPGGGGQYAPATGGGAGIITITANTSQQAAQLQNKEAAGGGGSEVEDFISENRLDDGAARAMRNEAQAVQDEVISRGSLLSCTNPSSAVMGRIREARQAVSSSGGGGGYGSSGGSSGGFRSTPY